MNKKTALMYAVDLLARQEQSEKRLREKLQRKGYEAEEIEAAIARLHEKHYLSDEEACQHQFDYLYRESRNSVRQICLKLQQRGFEAEEPEPEIQALRRPAEDAVQPLSRRL